MSVEVETEAFTLEEILAVTKESNRLILWNDDINTLQLNHVYHRDLLLDRLADVQGTETNLHAFSGLVWKTGKFTINPALRVDHFIFNLHDLLNVEQFFWNTIKSLLCSC